MASSRSRYGEVHPQPVGMFKAVAGQQQDRAPLIFRSEKYRADVPTTADNSKPSFRYQSATPRGLTPAGKSIRF
jgi:hypothetical protein